MTLNCQALFEAVSNPCLVLDHFQCMIGANSAYFRWTGCELPDVVGRWVWEAHPMDPDIRDRMTTSFNRAVANAWALFELNVWLRLLA